MKFRSRSLLLLGALVAAVISFFPLPVEAIETEVTVPIEASQYQYEPGLIEVSLGQQVVIELSSTDVVHGIYVDGYDLEVIADPGQKIRLSFTADRPGTFRLRCSVTCGPLHPFMIGKIIVIPDPSLRWIIGGSVTALLLGIALVPGNDRQTN
jgi:heme/copper-type cytochrome/quinol oxidase subunit 2